jgi:hypothetical protein
MLRLLVLALGGIAVAAGALLVGSGTRGPGIYLICVGAAIILGTAFERWRYRNAPPTYDRASGERRYVRAGESASGK